MQAVVFRAEEKGGDNSDMKSVAIVGAACTLLLVAAVATPQSLGEVAKQEAERRKGIKASGKVYTNENVRPDPTSAAPVSSAPPAPAAAVDAKTPAADDKAPAAGADAGAKPGTTPADDPKTEAYWKKRVTGVRDSLSRAQTFAEALQTRINALSADFVNRDDPAQRNMIAADRQKATDELARVKTEIAGFEKALTAIQDEARRANVPAGWVR
jgi:hypothetical protein